MNGTGGILIRASFYFYWTLSDLYRPRIQTNGLVVLLVVRRPKY